MSKEVGMKKRAHQVHRVQYSVRPASVAYALPRYRSVRSCVHSVPEEPARTDRFVGKYCTEGNCGSFSAWHTDATTGTGRADCAGRGLSATVPYRSWRGIGSVRAYQHSRTSVSYSALYHYSNTRS